MKILCIGTSGVYHVLIAANLLISSEIEHVFLSTKFANYSLENEAHPIYVGKYGVHDIYTLGIGNDIKIGQKILQEFGGLLGFKESDLLIIPIYIRREWVIKIISKLSLIIKEEYIYKNMVKFFVKLELENLKCQIEEAKIRIYRLNETCS